MTLICDSIKAQFATQSARASASIHRHVQAGMAEELVALGQSVMQTDGRDTYGRDGCLAQFERQLCDLFGLPACVFLPTGTLAQCVALKYHSEQSGRTGVSLHPTSHLLLHEHMAVETLWGLKVSELGAAHEVLTVEDLAALDPTATAAIIVETPMREIGGALPAWEDLIAMRAWCDKHGVKLHLDGARIWQTTVYYQSSLADIAALFDSIYVSFYKDLGGISGAALLGTDDAVEQARIWARRAGGNPITLYPEVLAARKGLNTYLTKMPELVAYTQQLCNALDPVPVTVLPEQPQVAMFHVRIAMNAEAVAERIVDYASKTGIIVLPLPRSGDQDSCVCEISIGDQAIAHPPAFWAEHIQRCFEVS